MPVPGARIARTVVVASAGALLIVSWLFIMLPSRGLQVPAPGPRDLPMTLYMTPGARMAPGVILVHGFGSSRQVMNGFALVLARAGYGVLTLDFGGHGANRRPMNRAAGSLQEDIDRAYRTLTTRPEIDVDRVAILGHSMGSGAAMAAAIRDPERYSAVVAVSPTDAPVTSSEPRNLLLMAGTWEDRFLQNARSLLERAGGATTRGAAFAAGTARALVAVENVEHITILFSHQSHDAALRWMDAAFGRQSGPAYRDRRVLWLGMQFAAWMALVAGLAPLLRRLALRADASVSVPSGRPVLWWLTGVIAPFAATGMTVLISRFAPLAEFGGVLVGGTLALWFLVAGLLWLLPGFRPEPPSLRGVAVGIGVFAVLFAAVGLGAHQVIMNWFMTPGRLLRWPVAALAVLPWTLAAGYAQAGRPAWQRGLVFLAETVVVVAALAMSGLTVPGLYFVVLLLPALPVALGAGAIVGGAVDQAWGFAVGNALFLGWMLMAVFPMV